MPVLPTASGLADEPSLTTSSSGDRLAIGHLGAAHPAIHAELAYQPIAHDVEMQFAHAGKQGLAALRIDANLNRRIFGLKDLQGLTEFVLVHSRRRLDPDRNHGLGKLDALENDRLGFVADGVAGGDLSPVADTVHQLAAPSASPPIPSAAALLARGGAAYQR